MIYTARVLNAMDLKQIVIDTPDPLGATPELIGHAAASSGPRVLSKDQLTEDLRNSANLKRFREEHSSPSKDPSKELFTSGGVFEQVAEEKDAHVAILKNLGRTSKGEVSHMSDPKVLSDKSHSTLVTQALLKQEIMEGGDVARKKYRRGSSEGDIEKKYQREMTTTHRYFVPDGELDNARAESEFGRASVTSSGQRPSLGTQTGSNTLTRSGGVSLGGASSGVPKSGAKKKSRGSESSALGGTDSKGVRTASGKIDLSFRKNRNSESNKGEVQISTGGFMSFFPSWGTPTQVRQDACKESSDVIDVLEDESRLGKGGKTLSTSTTDSAGKPLRTTSSSDTLGNNATGGSRSSQFKKRKNPSGSKRNSTGTGSRGIRRRNSDTILYDDDVELNILYEEDKLEEKFDFLDPKNKLKKSQGSGNSGRTSSGNGTLGMTKQNSYNLKKQASFGADEKHPTNFGVRMRADERVLDDSIFRTKSSAPHDSKADQARGSLAEIQHENPLVDSGTSPQRVSEMAGAPINIGGSKKLVTLSLKVTEFAEGGVESEAIMKRNSESSEHTSASQSFSSSRKLEFGPKSGSSIGSSLLETDGTSSATPKSGERKIIKPPPLPKRRSSWGDINDEDRKFSEAELGIITVFILVQHGFSCVFITALEEFVKKTTII